MINNLVVPL